MRGGDLIALPRLVSMSLRVEALASNSHVAGRQNAIWRLGLSALDFRSAPERTLKGISFAVANVNGILARESHLGE
jgi:hypothetical protein